MTALSSKEDVGIRQLHQEFAAELTGIDIALSQPASTITSKVRWRNMPSLSFEVQAPHLCRRTFRMRWKRFRSADQVLPGRSDFVTVDVTGPKMTCV
jgi:hypothetical protein